MKLKIPATLESFSRAPGFNVYLPVSNKTSDMLTINPRALSRVCRMAFNCKDNRARIAALSFSATCSCCRAWFAARRACSVSA